MLQSPKSRMVGWNTLFYPILAFTSCLLFIYFSFGDFSINSYPRPELDFVRVVGSQFVVEGRPFYVNGWNSYWLMDRVARGGGTSKVRAMMRTGSKMGLTVCRTWAFSDGGYNALQTSPGHFDERIFQALDQVIAEANQQGIRLLLCLVNNLQAYGGKSQYVKWAMQEGVGLSSSNDSFFYDPSIRQYFKNYVRTVITRKNTITGVHYRDDPTIFGWELINEPRCMTDSSGDTLQDWIEEMATFVKSIDNKHLVTVGLEGFYGPSSPKRLTVNPQPELGEWASLLGSDFIRNSKVSAVDFASAHIYPDHWLKGQGFEEKVEYVSLWMRSHIDDGDKELKKPVMFTEFGYSNLNEDYKPSRRDKFFRVVFDVIYDSAKKNGSGAGSFLWQLLVGGMEDYNDDFGMFPWDRPSMDRIITEHSCRLAKLGGSAQMKGYLKDLCLHRRR
ncbi:hypothetical protein SAY87_017616 [Trapa incisa]|uniref:mannan endo-1,4-beta-mannosidase n=1 Tax=Trapa incisa TaxID=236973 RepID=A0AAN7L431_9MYRT|nr:hypothetical protein SAY87_017616 [Trapa incisa]